MAFTPRGIFNFTNDSGITLGAIPTSSFVNSAAATLPRPAAAATARLL
jgi:hypothetical protein